MDRLSIGELAATADVNVQTIRYYEKRGLLAEPPRSASGYREYPESDVGRVRFIRRAQGLGFTLAEIGDLLSLRVDPDTTRAEVHQKVEEKIDDIDARIASMQEIRDALGTMAENCQSHQPLSECPFLDALEAQETAVG